MTPIVITAHAAQRWQERVDPTATLDQARAAIDSHSTAIAKAAAFGCSAVLLSSGIRPVLCGTRVVTVTDAHPAHNRRPLKVIARSIRQRRREREGAAE